VSPRDVQTLPAQLDSFFPHVPSCRNAQYVGQNMLLATTAQFLPLTMVFNDGGELAEDAILSINNQKMYAFSDFVGTTSAVFCPGGRIPTQVGGYTGRRVCLF
jgi:hypothetical protein